MNFAYYLSGMMVGVGNTTLVLSKDTHMLIIGFVLLTGAIIITFSMLFHDIKTETPR